MDKVKNGLNENKLSSQIYEVIRSLHEQGKCKSNWIENVKRLLQTNGYGNVWPLQNEINTKWLVLSFKQKLKDQYLQNWNALVEKASSGVNYRIFKDSFEMNTYFTYLTNRQCKILTAFRTRNHKLPIETGRWSGKPLNERLCGICKNKIGDEYHYLMECDYFKDQRKLYLKQYFTKRPNTHKLNSLMNSSNQKTIRNLSTFVEIIMKAVST